MALNTYDVAKHHVGLKEKGGGTLFGFMLLHGYDKQLQREGIGAMEFGGQTDLIGQNPALSRWTQDDFTGGAFQYDYGRDDAMFADCSGLLPSQRARSLYTIPPLMMKQQIDTTDDLHFLTGIPVAMFNVVKSIYVVFEHGIYRYRTDTGVLTFSNSPIDSPDTNVVGAQFDDAEGIIYLLTNRVGAVNPRPQLVRLKTDLTLADQTDYLSPAALNGVQFRSKGFQLCDTYILVGCGQRLYVVDPPENQITPGLQAKWTKAGRLPGYWKDSISFNGMTYILCSGFQSRTQIIAYDGSSLMPICTFPFNFEGKSIVEYGGRVFVGGIGYDANGDDRYAELYEVTGSSVRLVRTFSPEVYRFGGQNPLSIVKMVVYEGLLWFMQKGERLMAYDLTTDGFFGASELQGVPDGQMWEMCPGRGRLWGFIHSASNPTTDDGIYRIAMSGDEGDISAYTPELVTSDFSFEPGVKKRWSEIRVLTRYGDCDVEYSVDGGANWTAVATTTTTTGDFRMNVASLVDITPVEHIRFRLKFPRGTVVSDFTELVAYTVSFAFLDTGKRGWSFVVNGADEIEGRDGTSVVQDVGDYASQLWTWARDKTKLTFRDLDGTDADVSIMGFGEHHPVIGPNIDGELRPEAHYSVSLIEV